MRRSFAVTAVFTALLCSGCSDFVPPVSPSSVQSGAPASQGGAHSAPFQGSFEGIQTVTPLPPGQAQVNGSASGSGTHLGRFTVTFPHIVTFATATGTGIYTFTAANGDLLTATFTGQAQQGPIVFIVEAGTITGGTGRFAGATGTFTVQRQFVSANGTTTGSFEGTISWPGAAN